MGKKNKNSNALGKSLIKDRFSSVKKVNSHEGGSMIHTADLNDGYDWGRLNLRSVTEESSFQEFLSTAQLAGTEFEAEKLNLKFVKPIAADITSRNLTELEDKHKNLLKIPRRPKWNEDTTPSQLDLDERNLFLEWRRNLAILQENEGFLLTPYERNLEFWRQLWRVIERSDIVMQIVDARNPLMFRCEDLEKYVKEVSSFKENVLLINKADFLTIEQRKYWTEYFTSQKIKVIFFSATNLTLAEEDSELGIESLIGSISVSDGVILNSHKILTSEELISFFKTYHQASRVTENKTTVGLVGYPNVGKSSTLNTLLSAKKVAVSATPGKTKHFQTFLLDEDVILCDCPGLVMPSFVSTKSDMIVNGILSIDQMRDHVPPVTLVAKLVPRHILEDTYGFILPKPLEGEDPDRCPTSEEVLNAFGYNRGFMTQNGQPDNARSARYILKDFVAGKLLYCYAPPNVLQSKYHMFPEKKTNRSLDNADPRYLRAIKQIKSTTEDIDKSFFKDKQHSAHAKGLKKILTSSTLTDADAKAIVDNHSGAKPWKQYNKHANKKKKEKLRRIYADLDQH